MSRTGLLAGIGEIVRDPQLLLIEIGWRWSFGAIAILICGLAAFLILDRVTLDPGRLQAIAVLNPLKRAQYIAEGVLFAGVVLGRIALAAGLVMAAIWVLFSALGRFATLARPALAPGASLEVCLLVSVVRALVTFLSVAAWLLAGVLAVAIGSAGARNGSPNFGLMSALLLLAFLLILPSWSALNWLLSLVPLAREPSCSQSWQRTLKLIRSCRDEVLEISIVTGVLRAGSLLVALLLSLAAISIIRNNRVLLADLLAIALLHFLLSDFLHVAKLVALGRLRDQSDVPPSVVLSTRQHQRGQVQAGDAWATG